jgi:hypothetical protein
MSCAIPVNVLTRSNCRNKAIFKAIVPLGPVQLPTSMPG